ncbi:Ribosomal protein L4/L1 family [Perilla frutescens var. hirtella]|uniref:Ribosomal protein L4/L1 family n=1 Tax=Perilla frutescens var. hirtella TaxID=608512 RepID=A0AAD4NZA6_PERFH|nr:Ribosomal protein L4/L1 family [Perilla frutescens var. hirtella]
MKIYSSSIVKKACSSPSIPPPACIRNYYSFSILHSDLFPCAHVPSSCSYSCSLEHGNPWEIPEKAKLDGVDEEIRKVFEKFNFLDNVVIEVGLLRGQKSDNVDVTLEPEELEMISMKFGWNKEWANCLIPATSAADAVSQAAPAVENVGVPPTAPPARALSFMAATKGEKTGDESHGGRSRAMSSMASAGGTVDDSVGHDGTDATGKESHTVDSRQDAWLETVNVTQKHHEAIAASIIPSLVLAHVSDAAEAIEKTNFVLKVLKYSHGIRPRKWKMRNQRYISRKEVKRATLKKSPLKNLNVMLKLNLYAKTAKKMALLVETQRVKAKQENKLDKKRNSITLYILDLWYMIL